MPESITETWRALAWEAAASLGVSSTHGGGISTVIDPEALLTIAMLVPDVRLHGELLDWATLHATVLMPSRLRRIAREAGVDAVAERWMATIDAGTSRVSWRASEPALDGFVRSGKSTWFDPSSPAALALNARVLGGATTRTELLRALHPVTRGFEPAIDRTRLVHAAAVARGQVHAVLDELVDARFVTRRGSPRRQLLIPARMESDELAAGYWHAWSQAGYAPWRDAAPLVAGILRAAVANDDSRSRALEDGRTLSATLDSIAAMGGPALDVPRGAPLDVRSVLRDHASSAGAWLSGRLRAEPRK